jgi:hypothetical protein
MENTEVNGNSLPQNAKDGSQEAVFPEFSIEDL